MEKVEKLSMCRICLVEDVRMCVVTNKSLQQMYEKLTDVPFVTEDRKPMFACLFCCTRLQQCCQLQRKCVEAEQLLAHMLREDYEQKPLTNRAHLGCVGGFIITPIENISIVDDCQTASDAVKQELAAVCEEQDVELESENLYNSHPDVEAHHSESESEDPLLVEIKIEKEELSENIRNSEPERAGVAKTLILQRLLEEGMPAKQTTNVPSDLTVIRTIPSTSESVAKIKEDTTTSKNNFSQSSNSIHIGTPTDEYPFKCDVCQCSFTEATLLKKHMRIHKVKPYKCDVCQRSFGQKSNFERHSKIHFREKTFICDVCQRSFSRKTSLDEHYRNHTGEKPFKCNVCQSSFSRSASLKQHKQIHTGVKPYKCDICQRSFSQKSNFVVHFRNHSTDKPFKCHLCRRSYAQSCLLKQHLRIHTGERPYECHVCKRTFIYKCSLNKHFRLNHSDEKKVPK
ncbi:hypothetical protein PYW08_012246 [Mythimna loreyi]|uniref:Uncharacterized protein n=1 Tax=Mythimna loreyi TaxID=667449 RepID=A0ACC2Q389_9NEOP|nr:hypothetical protein PYW08_012246 [Mythimna loreyi]